MLQRFTSALFGGSVEELSLHGQPEQEKRAEEEDGDWILVNYLGEAYTQTTRSGKKNDNCWFRFSSMRSTLNVGNWS